MAATGLLALIDEITTVLDDVAMPTKVAAKKSTAAVDDVAALTKVATKKTAGVLGDDLALNARAGDFPEASVAARSAQAPSASPDSRRKRARHHLVVSPRRGFIFHPDAASRMRGDDRFGGLSPSSRVPKTRS